MGSDEGFLSDYMVKLLSGEAETLMKLMFLSLCRLLPIVGMAPFLGAKVLPHPVKIVLALSLWLIFLPMIASDLSGEIVYGPIFFVLAAKELLIGTILGFLISIPFILMQSVGFIIDHQRGAASLMVSDPAVQNQASPIGLFYNFILIYLFYYIDGPFYFF
ncbi:flagellar biosynthetic protein FliR [Chlamydiales bacterium]|nr:flagellar biosynthetic protein FliR [Chlamydiales bacterium]